MGGLTRGFAQGQLLLGLGKEAAERIRIAARLAAKAKEEPPVRIYEELRDAVAEGARAHVTVAPTLELNVGTDGFQDE